MECETLGGLYEPNEPGDKPFDPERCKVAVQPVMEWDDYLGIVSNRVRQCKRPARVDEGPYSGYCDTHKRWAEDIEPDFEKRLKAWRRQNCRRWEANRREEDD